MGSEDETPGRGSTAKSRADESYGKGSAIMANILEATQADNRGTDDIPYGFVYFSDGLRVTYTGRLQGDQMTYEVHESSGGWGPITETHRRLAGVYLRNQS